MKLEAFFEKQVPRLTGLEPSSDSGDALALTFAVRIAPRKKPSSWRDRISQQGSTAGSAQAA